MNLNLDELDADGHFGEVAGRKCWGGDRPSNPVDDGSGDGDSRPLDVPDTLLTQGSECFVERLPTEVLSAAFAFLPLVDGLRASHVSQAWRSVALATPDIWAHLRMKCRRASQFEFATMVLSRSGSLGRVVMDSDYPTPKSAFRLLIKPHLHKLRSLDWASDIGNDALLLEAPFLENLRLGRAMLHIQQAFLGGKRGRLRGLQCRSVKLPTHCPALSSLVELHVAMYKGDAASFAGLFDLCPGLESLTIIGIRSGPNCVLPRGPAPQALRKLTLKSSDPSCDLLALFSAWRTPSLRTVSLDMTRGQRGHPGPLPGGFLSDAVTLSVREPSMRCCTWIVAARENGGEHSLGLAHLPPAQIADLVLGAHAMLQRVRALSLTLAVLESFAAVAAALPALAEVTIHIESLSHAQSTPRIITWHSLESLSTLLDAAPQIATLEIAVWCSWTAAGLPANVEDAQFILERLEFLATRPGPLPDVHILGFIDADIPDLGELEQVVQFDSVESVGYPPYSPFEEDHDDF